MLACDSTWRRPGKLKQENHMKSTDQWPYAIPLSIFCSSTSAVYLHSIVSERLLLSLDLERGETCL